MSDENLTPASNGGPGGHNLDTSRTAVIRPDALELAAAGWPEQMDALPGKGVSGYLHAFRRRWFVAVLLAVVAAAGAGVGTWFAQPPKYTARALLRTAMDQAPLVFQTADRSSRTSFDVYKNTQQQLIQSPLVLNAALRQEDVAKLSLIREQLDPVKWLSEELHVSFPGDAEIMTISLSGDEPEALARIVNSVVRAYLEGVVEDEHDAKLDRLSDLEEAYGETETKLRKKRDDLRRLAETLGTGDSEALTLVQQNALQQYSQFRQELTRVEFELMRSEGELKIRQSLREKYAKQENPDQDAEPEEITVSDAELASVVQSDAIARQLRSKIDELEKQSAHAKEVLRPEKAAPYLADYQKDIDEAQQEVDARRDVLRDQLLLAKRRAVQKPGKDTLEELQTKVAVLQAQKAQLQKDVSRLENDARQSGRSSIEVEMLRFEIQSLEDILNQVGGEIQRTRIELRPGSRVTVLSQAHVPVTPDRSARISLSVVAGAFGLLLPMFAIVWWDTRQQRISTSEEVAQGLQLNVIGSVPFIPARALRGLKRGSKKQRYWQSRLKESVDGITAFLLRKAETAGQHVVMVTSAVPGEGKTTLAGHLAVSLARAGRKTLLLDFDLRSPALDRTFEVELRPGISDVLHGTHDLQSVIRETETSGLSLITAGESDRDTLRALTSERAKTLFETLREEFDFVVVDGSPVLPVVDTRLIGRYVDAVILSVLRDVSQAPQVLAACEVLESFNVNLLGAVVTGTSSEVYYNKRYHRLLPSA